MIVAVLAEAPIAGRCLKPLIPYNDEAWLARLSAAMLRDTLDGLENIPADRYVVLTDDADEEGRRVLERHLPLPWTLASVSDVREAARDGFVVATTLAPAADIEPLLAASESFVVVGGDWLYGQRGDQKHAFHIRLPDAVVVTTQPALDTLCEELRSHHERAPRTAQLAMTS